MTEHDDLEQVLRGLPLRRPSAALDGRIAASLARRPWHPVRWAVAAAALLIAGVVLHHPGRPAPVAQPVSVEPVSVEQVVSQTVDDGVVSVTDHVPYRQVRRQTVRQIWWADPATGAKMWAQVPSEQVTVEPAETF